MKIIISKPNDYARNFMRKCGYAAFTDPRTHEDSFVKRLTGDFYPRFHAYAKENDDELIINLHLDQKKASYEGADHAHSGEYDGELVEQEAQNIKETIAYYAAERRGGDND